MNRARNKMRFNAWLAICAMLLNMLVPSISHAVASSQGKQIPWQQICTSTGIKFSADIAKQDPNAKQNRDKPAEQMPMTDCVMCMAHAGSDLIHNSEYATLEISITHYTLPELFYQSPRPLFVWAAASPRAPPFIS